MYRPRTALVPGMGTVTPNGDVSATEWLPVQAEAHLSSTRTYDTRAFPSIQDAIDTAYANGGGTVFLGDSELTPQTLTLRDGVYLTGRGIGATKLKVTTIVGDGSVTQLPGLLSTASKDGRIVSFNAAHGLQPGDVFIIWNKVESSYSTSRTYYNAGEFCKVAVVTSATQVTLTHPLYDTYASGADREIYKLNPIRTGVSNMSIEGTSPHAAVNVRFGSDLEFSNLSLTGSDNAHLSIGRCYSVSINRVKTFDSQPVVGTSYGIVIGNSQRIRISDCELEASSHGLTTGGGNQTCNVPNRDITVSDSFIGSTLSTLGSGRCGCNLHGNTEHIRFNNCTFPTGINPAGDYVTIANCDIRTPAWGSAIYMSEMLGANLTISDCRIRATDNHQTSFGLMYFQWGAAAQRAGRFRFINNEVDLAGYTGDGVLSIMMYVLRANGAGGVVQAEIKGNYFTAGSPIDRRAVRMVTGTATEWTRVDFVDNSHHPSLESQFHEQATLVYFDGYGVAVPTFAAKRGSRYMRVTEAGTDSGRLYVNQSGTTSWTMK